MTAVILTGGSLSKEFAAVFLETTEYDLLIGADRGVEVLADIGAGADIIAGDFDSADERKVLKYIERYEPEVRRYPPEKDYTDTEIAIRAADEKSADTVYILGGLGTRFDHSLGNIHALNYLLERGKKGYIIDENNKIHLLGGAKAGHYFERFEKNSLFGRYVSLLPFTREVENVTLKGFKYPLENGKFIAGGGGAFVGISNELRDETATVEFEKGILIVAESGE